MHTEISISYEFEGLRVTLDGCPDVLFGTVEILVDKDLVARRSWRIGAIKVDMRPDYPEHRLRLDSAVYERLCRELAAQRRDQIDDVVSAALDERGGYMALFGERMPAGGAGGTRARPGSYLHGSPVQDRAMSRTFVL